MSAEAPDTYLGTAYRDAKGAFVYSGKTMGRVLAKTADAVYLKTAFTATTKYAKKGATKSKRFMRRQFFAQYANVDIQEEEEGESDGDDTILTDEELKQRVEACFFDKEFDPVQAGVDFLSSIQADREAEVRGELDLKEVRRKEQHDVVANTLKKRVLLQHREFVEAIHQVGLVKTDLRDTSVVCGAAKQRIRASKDHIVVRGLMIPKLDRRRHNLRAVQELVDAMHALHEKYDRVMGLLDSHKLREAVLILHASKMENYDDLMRVKSMCEVVNRWRCLLDDPLELAPYAFMCVDACLHKFSSTQYGDLMEAVRMTGSEALAKSVLSKLNDSLMDKANSEIVRSLMEVSTVRDEAADIAHITEGIVPSSILSCICKLCARLVDFLWLYAHITRCHLDLSKSDEEGSATDLFHQEALGYLKSMAEELKIGSRIGTILRHAKLQKMDLDRALHIYHVAAMLVEVLSVLGGHARNREPLREAACAFLREQYLKPDMEQLYRAMVEDTWSVEAERKMRLMLMPVVHQLDPKKFVAAVSKIKKYLSEPAPSMATNPFLQIEYLDVQDTGKTLDIDIFQNTPMCQPHRAVAVDSSEKLCNIMFQSIARIVVRLPTIASETLGFMESLISGYTYVGATNLVSFTLEVPLEDQAGYTPLAREHLAVMRERAQGIVPTVRRKDGSISSFPPLLFNENRIKSLFGNSNAFFGIAARLTGLEAMYGVVLRHAASVEAVAPVLSVAVANFHRDEVAKLKVVIQELLEVGTHFLCNAILPLDELEADIGKTKFDKTGNKFVASFLAVFQKFTQKFASEIDEFPTQHTVDVFWSRCYYTIQCACIRAIASKRLTEAQFFNLSSDVGDMLLRVRKLVGNSHMSIFDKYTTVFLNTFVCDPEAREVWLRENHTFYRAKDLVPWLGGSGQEHREDRRRIELILRDVSHEDRLLLTNIGVQH